MSKTYEVKSVHVQAITNLFVNLSYLTDQINRYSLQGWRLASTIRLGDCSVILFFEKEVLSD